MFIVPLDTTPSRKHFTRALRSPERSPSVRPSVWPVVRMLIAYALLGVVTRVGHIRCQTCIRGMFCPPNDDADDDNASRMHDMPIAQCEPHAFRIRTDFGGRTELGDRWAASACHRIVRCGCFVCYPNVHIFACIKNWLNLETKTLETATETPVDHRVVGGAATDNTAVKYAE